MWSDKWFIYIFDSDCLSNAWANLQTSPIPLLAFAIFSFTWWLKFNVLCKCIPKCFSQVAYAAGASLK